MWFGSQSGGLSPSGDEGNPGVCLTSSTFTIVVFFLGGGGVDVDCEFNDSDCTEVVVAMFYMEQFFCNGGEGR